MATDGDRQSKAQAPALIHDEHAKAEREARNALQQFDGAIAIVDEYVQEPARKFSLRPSRILQLHRFALDGLSAFAGNFRPADVEIEGSDHEPVGAHVVPELVEEMCDYINENWENKSAIHLAAYTMWRLNWIHPFDDGNGRTARMISYVVLCVRLGHQLPGHYTIPEQIAENKTPYYEALEQADRAFKDDRIDVSAVEDLLKNMLALQLAGFLENASGGGTSHARDVKLH